MSLLLSQKETIGPAFLWKHFNRTPPRPLPQRSKALRLRQKGPQWALVALLVVVADALLAAAAWIAVDFLLR